MLSPYTQILISRTIIMHRAVFYNTHCKKYLVIRPKDELLTRHHRDSLRPDERGPPISQIARIAPNSGSIPGHSWSALVPRRMH